MVTAQHRIILVNEYQTKGLNQLSRGMDKGAASSKKMNTVMVETNKTSGDLLTRFTRMRWMLVNLAMAAALAYGTFKLFIKPAIDLETKMTGVAKTTGMAKDEIKLLQSRLFEISRTTPFAVDELADIARVAGQLGLASHEIADFVDSIAKISIATGMTTEQAATDFAKLAYAFNLPLEQIMSMGNVLNELENTTAATAQGMINALTRIGAAAEILGISFEKSSAAVATLISAGMGAERAGTRLRSLFSKIAQDTESFADVAGMSFEKFADLLQVDADAALQSVIDGINKSTDKSYKLAQAMDSAGRIGGFALATLASNSEELANNLDTVNDQLIENNSILQEWQKRMEDTSSQWIIFSNIIKEDTLSIGEKINENMIKPLLEFFITLRTGEDGLDMFIDSLDDMDQAIARGNISVAQANKILQAYGQYLSESNNDFRAASRLINGLISDYIKLNQVQKNSIEDETPRFKMFRDQEGALQRYIRARDLATESEGESLEVMMLTQKTLKETEKFISTQFGDTALSVIKKYYDFLVKKREEEIKAQKETLSLTDLTWRLQLANRALQRDLSGVGEELSNVRSKMDGVGSTISNLLSRRFNRGGISETDIGYLIKQQQLELQKAQFATLGLGTAEEFLRDATIITTDSIDQQTEAVKRLTDAASDGQDQFESWQTTLQETIRSLLINSQDLDKDVTSVVRKAQTELLGITRFDRGGAGSDQYSAMEQNINALGLAQNIFFGSERDKLEYSEQLREDRINGMNESAEIAISNLEKERFTLDALITEEQRWIDQQQRIRDEMDKNKVKIDEITAAYRSGGSSSMNPFTGLSESQAETLRTYRAKQEGIDLYGSSGTNQQITIHVNGTQSAEKTAREIKALAGK